MVLDEQTKTLSYSVYQNLSARYAEEMRLNIGEGIAGRVAQSGKAVLLEDISAEPEAARRDLISIEGLKAFVSIPLQSKGKILGVMNVTSHVPRHFTKTDKHFLHAIGDLLGVGIETAKLYEQLSMSRESYRQLARQTLVAQEEGRKWLARELHDGTSQSLSGMALQLQALIDTAKKSESHDTEFITRLKKVHDLTVQVHTEISRLIANLHPPLLDTLGLVPAIRQHAESSLRHLGINVSVEARGRIRPLLPEAEIELFRFAQGAIANIAQHSKAKNATIYIEYKDNELLLKISDDGQGFDISQIMHIEENGRGRGIFSMRERIKILNGTMIAESQPGQGTTIQARVPII
jgi:signal transduction histidine kinase